MLDGGKLLLFTLSTALGPSRWDTAQVVGQSMTSGERHVVASGASAARYVATFGNPVALPIEDTIHPIQQRNYDVTADGQRLVVVVPAQAAQAAPGNASRAGFQVNIVLNWFDELAQRVPARQ